MKITQVETLPIHVPLKPDVTIVTSRGRHAVSPYVLIRIHTDEGITGIGEATLSPMWTGETRPGGLAAIRDLFAPELIGRDPRDVNALMRRVERSLVGNPFAKAAVDMALWDIAGKAAGLPVYQLLGGKVRDELPIKLVIGGFPPRGSRCARSEISRLGCQDPESEGRGRRRRRPDPGRSRDGRAGHSNRDRRQ